MPGAIILAALVIAIGLVGAGLTDTTAHAAEDVAVAHVSTNPSPFPRPAALEPSINFWIKAFTFWGERDFVVHDRPLRSVTIHHVTETNASRRETFMGKIGRRDFLKTTPAATSTAPTMGRSVTPLKSAFRSAGKRKESSRSSMAFAM